MRYIKYITSITLLIICVACVSDTERISNFKNKCAFYGYKSGSVEMARCVQNEELNFQKNFSRAINDLSEHYNRSLYVEVPKQTVCNTSGSIDSRGWYSGTTTCQ